MRITHLLVLAAVLCGPYVTAQTPSAQPVGTMSELMVEVIYPTSDAIFYVMRSVPANDYEWGLLEGKALMLAESANLLMMPGRTRDQTRWMKDARLLLDAGAAAFKAAKAKNLQALVDLNEQLYQSCVTCHAHYRPNYRGPQPTAPRVIDK